MKILIVGTVGAGKTTLAKKLSKEYKIKYWEIDSIVHNDANNGIKRSFSEQDKLIEEIDKNQNWILEGVLRKNLYYLLEKADRIIYLDVNKNKRNMRILKRFLKQKLKLEKANYKVDLQMLKMMLKCSNEFDYIIGMEEKNISNILRIVGNDTENKIFKLLDFSDTSRDISDPWYTGDFNKAYKDIYEGCNSLLNYLLQNR